MCIMIYLLYFVNVNFGIEIMVRNEYVLYFIYFIYICIMMRFIINSVWIFVLVMNLLIKFLFLDWLKIVWKVFYVYLWIKIYIEFFRCFWFFKSIIF